MFLKRLLNSAMKVAFVLLLVNLQLASQKPLTREDLQLATRERHLEDVRLRWNEGKKIKRMLTRRRRHVVREVNKRDDGQRIEPPVQIDSLQIEHRNASGSKYIVELYNNFTRHQGPIKQTQANTIRSLPSVTPTPMCDTFNFSLSAFNTDEYILKSELFLYLKDPPPSVGYVPDSYIVVVHKYSKGSTDLSGEEVTSKEVFPMNNARWIMFDVRDITQKWVRDNTSHAVFGIKVYKNVNDKKQSENALDCQEGRWVDFEFNPLQEDKAPYLAVYSYNPEIEKIDYQSILQQLEQNSNKEVSKVSSRKRKRSAPPVETPTNAPPACAVNTLNITARDIPAPKPWEKVIQPLHYDAGICGGGCDGAYPFDTHLKHTQLVRALLNRNRIVVKEESNYSFTQCCAPVEWASLHTLVQGERMYLSRLDHMIITKCQCMDVLRFS